ncbi:hypothetical protein ACH5RR_003166, partial [Cinchona calisaya]
VDSLIEVAIVTNSRKNGSGISIMGRDRDGKLLKIWAEGREDIEDIDLLLADSLTTSLLLAKESRWNRVEFVAADRNIMQKLMKSDSEDVKCATILEGIINLSLLFSIFLFSWEL